MTYDTGFYDTARAGAQSSAAAVVPLVLQHVTPTTVIDVGCGEGWWAAAFAEAGCDVLGIDGAVLDDRPAGPRYAHHDLTASFAGVGHFDLAVALEVGEHLPPWRAEGFIADLCAVAPVVLFSAAIPGQGGTGHINEQTPSYWVEKFNTNNYAVSGALRWAIWDDPQVENWYRQNLMVATDAPNWFPGLFDTPLAQPWHVVHPVLFDARRH